MAVRITRAGVGLTIGIIILGLVVLGGLYLVKQRGEQARRDQAIQVAQQNLESQSNDNGATAPTDTNSTNSGSSSTDNSSNSTSNNGASNSSNPSNSGTPNSASQLPQTGPADQWVSLLAVAFLTFAISGYIVSKQQLRSSL